MTVIRKTARFDAAHMLSGYEGPCANLHGHGYRIEVAVKGGGEGEGADGGMVFDFRKLKRILADKVLARFDHSLIVNTASPLEGEIADLLRPRGMKIAEIDTPSTCENLARIIFDILVPEITGLQSVSVWETPDNHAEYSP